MHLVSDYANKKGYRLNREFFNEKVKEFKVELYDNCIPCLKELKKFTKKKDFKDLDVNINHFIITAGLQDLASAFFKDKEIIRQVFGCKYQVEVYNSFDEAYRLWGKINMSWPNASTFGPRYNVLHPVTKKPVKIPGRGWRWKEETFNAASGRIDDEYKDIVQLHDGSFRCGRMWFSQDENTQPSSITYLDEVNSFLLRSILSTKSDGGNEIEGLFNGKSYFSYPKPTNLFKNTL